MRYLKSSFHSCDSNGYDGFVCSPKIFVVLLEVLHNFQCLDLVGVCD